jgi:hypothetical protein
MFLTTAHSYPGQSVLHRNIPVFYTQFLPLNYSDKNYLLLK